jgi:hypothetical protein
MRWYHGAFLGVIVLLLLAAAPALAGEESGTTTLEDGETLDIAIDNPDGDYLRIDYAVRVLEGPTINVWVLDEEGLKDFRDENASRFSYWNDGSHEEVSTVGNHFYFDDVGGLYLVIDNDFNDAEGQSVLVEYTVTWEDAEYDTTMIVLLVALIVIIMVAIVIIVAVLAIKRAQLVQEAQKAEEGRESEPEWDATDRGRPRPPEPYPAAVVEASTRRGMEDDDATGWDPSRGN